MFTEVDWPSRIVFDSIMAMGEEGRDKGGQDFGTNVTVTFEERWEDAAHDRPGRLRAQR